MTMMGLSCILYYLYCCLMRLTSDLVKRSPIAECKCTLAVAIFTVYFVLIEWSQEVTVDVPSVKITNMTTSWRSGLGFLAIIRYYRPDLVQ